LLNEHNDELATCNRVIVNNTKDFINKQHKELVEDTMVFLSKPKLILQRKDQTLQHLQQNIKTQVPKLISSKAAEMNHYVKVMKLMSPVNIMKKGFAIISINDEVLINADKIKKGTTVKINMYQAELDAEIINKTNNDGKKYDI
jgi:exodeoxyribonuclease VII large subunit